MPTDRSMTDSSAGVIDARGTNQGTPKGVKKPKLRRRRLRESDVNVVDQPTLKKALSGTIVGNTMEWYDVGVFGYLITTMGPVFLPEADKSVQNLFLLGTFAATFIARPLGGSLLRLAWRQDRPPEGPRHDPDDHGRVHVRRRAACPATRCSASGPRCCWSSPSSSRAFPPAASTPAPPRSSASTPRTAAAASSPASWTWAATSASPSAPALVSVLQLILGQDSHGGVGLAHPVPDRRARSA